MRFSAITTLVVFSIHTWAQDVVTLTGTNTRSLANEGGDYVTTGVTYADDGTTISITATRSGREGTATDLASVADRLNSTMTPGNFTKPSQTTLAGGTANASASLGTGFDNATATTSSAQPTNTVPCNGHPSFCSRSYSNITQVAAHNSPFIQPGSIASNQMLDVETQLNDGIRMLQFQTHQVNGSMYLCHTSCDLLNAGLLEDYLTTVVGWMRQNPQDVVTILMGNDDIVSPDNYVAPVTNSGLIDFVYIPPALPMSLEDWPTLGEMVLTNQRAVVMLDYEANQQEVPWLLDEFSHMWETPFSPTDRDFPCTAQRPPDRPEEIRRDRMYMANHNLNVAVSIAGMSLLIPASTIVNETNAVSGYGSAGAMVGDCTRDWNRPPNFILVDYYNLGNFNGSVFEVAAMANNVTYDRESCCGTEQRSFNAAMSMHPAFLSMFAVVLGVAVLL